MEVSHPAHINDGAADAMQRFKRIALPGGPQFSDGHLCFIPLAPNARFMQMRSQPEGAQKRTLLLHSILPSLFFIIVIAFYALLCRLLGLFH